MTTVYIGFNENVFARMMSYVVHAVLTFPFTGLPYSSRISSYYKPHFKLLHILFPSKQQHYFPIIVVLVGHQEKIITHASGAEGVMPKLTNYNNNTIENIVITSVHNIFPIFKQSGPSIAPIVFRL